MSFDRNRLVRRPNGRIVAGVATAVADSLGVDANAVRCGFLVLTLAGGIGALLYGAGWLLLPTAPSFATESRRSDPISTIAFSAVVLGALLLVRALGPWPGDVIVWPLGAAMVGLAVLSTRPRDRDVAPDPPDWPFLDRLPPEASDAVAVLFGTRRGALARIIAGAACIAAGLGAFFVSVDSWRALQGGIIGAAVVLVGFGLVLGPGVWDLVNQLVSERRERIRSDERADVAAHLHDSVLQTLALVQRRADDPREVVRLARMQERELRSWLLEGERSLAEGSLGGALEELAASVETEHGVPVEVVRVRDCPTAGMQPLLLAAREAMVNAVRHSGASNVAVYLEVEPRRVSIFVRDRGRGFDPATVAADRRGISGSIVDRLARAGGTCEVRSRPGEGTEIEMTMPRTTEAITT